MKEIATRVWIGSQNDFVNLGDDADGWAFVHACKEPHHRTALGYTGRAAPKDHPEYLMAVRDHRIMLNLVDVDDPAYVRAEIVDAGLAHMREAVARGASVLCHCNEGKSRGPTLGLLYLAPVMPDDFDEAESTFAELVPDYAPRNGVRQFAIANWERYRAQTGAGGPDRSDLDARLAKARAERA